MLRRFSAGVLAFEINDREVRLLHNETIIDRKSLPFVEGDLPSGERISLGPWFIAWTHLCIFDPTKAMEFRALATRNTPAA